MNDDSELLDWVRRGSWSTVFIFYFFGVVFVFPLVRRNAYTTNKYREGMHMDNL